MPIALPKRIPISFLHSLHLFPSLFSAPFLRHTKFHPRLPKAIPTSRTLFSGCSALPAHFSHLPFYSTLPPTHFIKTLPHTLNFYVPHTCPLPIMLRSDYFLRKNFYSSCLTYTARGSVFPCCKRKLRAPTDVPVVGSSTTT